MIVRNKELRRRLNDKGIKDIVLDFLDGVCLITSDDEETNNVLHSCYNNTLYVNKFRDQSIDNWVNDIELLWNDAIEENNIQESEKLNEKIIRVGSKWRVTDHTGKKNLGTYDTKKAAEKRLRQVEYFKHLNENEITDSEDFKNWFEGSKAVDNNGNPKVFYHGSISSFDNFKPSELGIYFTDDKDIAWSYGEHSVVYSVYLKMLNPLVLDFNGDSDTEETDEHYDIQTEAKNAFDNGYDSLIVYNTFDGENELDQYIVKDPSQIMIIDDDPQKIITESELNKFLKENNIITVK